MLPKRQAFFLTVYISYSCTWCSWKYYSWKTYFQCRITIHWSISIQDAIKPTQNIMFAVHMHHNRSPSNEVLMADIHYIVEYKDKWSRHWYRQWEPVCCIFSSQQLCPHDLSHCQANMQSVQKHQMIQIKQNLLSSGLRWERERWGRHAWKDPCQTQRVGDIPLTWLKAEG